MHAPCLTAMCTNVSPPPRAPRVIENCTCVCPLSKAMPRVCLALVLLPALQRFLGQPEIPVETAVRVYRRYLQLEPTHAEEFIAYLKSKVRHHSNTTCNLVLLCCTAVLYSSVVPPACSTWVSRGGLRERAGRAGSLRT
jgi:hypothetical protein